MAVERFENSGLFTGEYLGETGVTTATNLVETYIVEGITATKAADKEYWTDGYLNYTITLNNTSGEPYNSLVLTDQLSNLVVLDQTYGVFVDGTATTDYTYAGGLLTVNNLGTLADAASKVITFRVSMAP